MIFKWQDSHGQPRPTRLPLWLHARSSRTEMEKRSCVCFRQRHGGGRCVPASFQPSLRLHFTLPPAEPLTEAVLQEPDQHCIRPSMRISKSVAPSANSHPTILRRNRRKRPAHAAKSPTFSSDAMRETSRPKQTNLVSLVREPTKEKIECYQNIKNLLPIRRSW